MDDAPWLQAPPRPTLDLGVLGLRRWRAEDAPGLRAAVVDSEAELRPWMPWAQDYDLAAARAFLATAERGWEERTDHMYALVVPDGTVVGSCGLHARLGPGRLEVGYWVRSSHTGRGFASLAAAGLTAEALRLEDVGQVEIHCDRANQRSAMIPRRLGFRLVEVLPDDVLAPGEEGVELVWRMEARSFRTSPARRLLDEAGASV